jgi:hypothetical protein
VTDALRAKRGEIAGGGQWQTVWAKVEAAERAGQISKAATLCASIAEAEPGDGQLLHDTGFFILALNRNLAGLKALNDGHRNRFALTAEQFPIPVPLMPIGREGWVLAQECLLLASLREPERALWQNSLAEALELSGLAGQALHWRRNIARLQPDWRGNMLALGRLLEALGPPAAAARHYEMMLERWPADAEVLLRLAPALELSAAPQKAAAIYLRLQAEIDRAANTTPRTWARLVLPLAWAAARVGLSSSAASLTRALATQAQAVAAALPEDVPARLVEGYAALLRGDRAQARRCFAAASYLAQCVPPQASDARSQIETLGDPLACARAFLVESSTTLSSEARAVPAGSAELARVHARCAWGRGEKIASLQSYLAAVDPYLVPTLALEYEFYGGYKVLYHAENGQFLAVPRHVAEFTIIDGAVYVVTGMARLSRRRLPPWVVGVALRLRGWAGSLARTLPVPRRAGRIVNIVVLAFLRNDAAQRALHVLATLSWRHYLVRGVLVADRLETLLELIANHSSIAPAAGGPAAGEIRSQGRAGRLAAGLSGPQKLVRAVSTLWPLFSKRGL